MNHVNSTIDYYNKNAVKYSNDTVNVDFSSAQERFISLLSQNAYILDFGCGSGRDSKFFIDNGFIVDAIDGSEELCKLAESYAGINVKCMLFQEFEEKNKYDGIWACSSILHLTKIELKKVFYRMIESLKNEGIIYTSFKYSDFEGERNGRYFIDFTETKFEEFIREIKGINEIDKWISFDVRPNRENEKWLNLILKKS
ncbi:MAG: class I SAM-dependent methyltransferase [Eubacterium sp.]|nr:class I SAM-dependent methyltransferase [Eubacterium sp.]